MYPNHLGAVLPLLTGEAQQLALPTPTGPALPPNAISEAGAMPGGQPATVNYLGRMGSPEVASQVMSNVRDVQAQTEGLRQSQPAQQHKKGGIFREGGFLRNALGMIGDVLLVSNGMSPMYRPAMERRKVAEAMTQLGNGGDDMEALRRIYAINPQLGMQAEDQLYQRRERRREADFRTATGDMILGGSPDAYQRAVRADPTEFLTWQGKRLDVTKKDLEGWRDRNDTAMQILGGVSDQDSYNRARAQVGSLYQRYGEDPAGLNLPEQYSPEAIRDLQLRGMDTSKQLQAIARENRLEWDMEDDRLDNSRADRNQRSLSSYRQGQLANTRRGQDLRGKPTGRGTSAKPPSPTTVIGRIMEKQASGHPLTPAEQKTYDEYRAGRGRGGRSSGGSRDGAIIRNPKTGERMVLQGGKWVPLK